MLQNLLQFSSFRYAIGGLAGGEDKHFFWRVVLHSTQRLPLDKPRYLMGVGYPLDLVLCSAMGVDMFDCVWPTRTARFGTAIVAEGLLNLTKSKCATEEEPIEVDCPCITCARYSRAFLHTVAGKEDLGCHLVSIHNLSYMKRLMTSLRTSIAEGKFPEFASQFLLRQFPDRQFPKWVEEVCVATGLSAALGLESTYSIDTDPYFMAAGISSSNLRRYS